MALLVLNAPLSSLWHAIGHSADAVERALPGSTTLVAFFVVVFLLVFEALRIGASAGERRSTHELARARLGLSDEHALPLRGALRGARAHSALRPR